MRTPAHGHALLCPCPLPAECSSPRTLLLRCHLSPETLCPAMGIYQAPHPHRLSSQSYAQSYLCSRNTSLPRLFSYFNHGWNLLHTTVLEA